MALNARGERVGVAAGAALPAVPGRRRSLDALPGERAQRSPCSTGRRSPARSASRSSSTPSRRSTESRRRRARAMPRRHRRPLRAVVEGVHARAWSPGVFAELAGERPRRRFTIGINDDVSGTSLPYDADAGHRAAGHGARGLLRPRLGRHRRREQEHDQDPRRRGGPARPGLLRLRLEEVGLADGLAPALRARSRSGRPTSCSGASFVGCHQFGLLDRVDVLGRAADGATLLLNCPHAAGRGVGRAVPPGPGADPRQGHRRCTRSTPAGSPARSASRADQHRSCRPASSRSPACCRARRRSTGSRRRSTKTYGRRGAEVVERNQAAVDRALDGLHRVEVPERGDGQPRAPAARARARARVRPHGHRGDAGRPRRRAAGQRAAGRRHLPERHGGLREAQHLRAGRGLGRRPLHPVRQLQLRLPAQRDPLQVLRPVAAGRRAGRRSASAPLDAVGLPDTRYTLQVYVEDCTGCALCVEACPVVAPGRARYARRSTSRRASRSSTPSARTSRSSRRCPRPTARGSTSAPCAAPSSSSRCSSSPAPARAAARRRTSSCSRSSSATG